MTITVFAATADDARGRGRELGTTWSADIGRSWIGYQQLFAACDIPDRVVRDVGERTLESVATWSSPLAEEIAGIADGAGLDDWQVTALNARTEILGRSRTTAPGECSTSVHVPSDDAPRTIQTWDWYAHLRDVKLVWQLRPGGDRLVTTFTEFGVLGKIGVTSAGLGVHVNLLRHRDDGTGYGIPVHLVARRILDEATTLAEAEAIIRSAEVSASTAVTVVTYRSGVGAAATFELSPAGVAVISAADEDRQLLHTNHFLDPKLAVGERLASDDPDTVSRLRELTAGRAGLRAADIGERANALRMHREDGAALCCHPEPDAPFTARWETMLVVGFDLEHGRLLFRDGKPCDTDADAWVRV